MSNEQDEWRSPARPVSQGTSLPRLGLRGRVLMALSRSPGSSDLNAQAENGATDIELLRRVYPPFLSEVAGTRVLDFGCGDGCQAVGIAKNSPADVVGLDIQPSLLEKARLLAAEEGVQDRVTFVSEMPVEPGFDWIVSQNSMEHFRDPLRMLKQMQGALAPGGRILVTFCPTWLSPYGAHMHFFTRVPWVHLLFPERTVMSVRARFRSDGAMRYEDVTGGLNRMTVGRYRGLVDAVGLKVQYEKLEYVKDLQLLGRFPLTREFFTNRVTQVLRAPS